MKWRELSNLKKILFMLLTIVIVYVILWVAVLVACKLNLGPFESCIWNLKKYWFPFPKCVCVQI